jgi:hypothetical protein
MAPAKGEKAASWALWPSASADRLENGSDADPVKARPASFLTACHDNRDRRTEKLLSLLGAAALPSIGISPIDLLFKPPFRKRLSAPVAAVTVTPAAAT